MISLFQHTALLRRPLEVTHLSAEGGSQEKKKQEEMFPKKQPVLEGLAKTKRVS